MTLDLDQCRKNVGAFPAEEKSQSWKGISVHFTCFPEAWQVCVCVSWVACVWG